MKHQLALTEYFGGWKVYKKFHFIQVRFFINFMQRSKDDLGLIFGLSYYKAIVWLLQQESLLIDKFWLIGMRQWSQQEMHKRQVKKAFFHPD